MSQNEVLCIPPPPLRARARARAASCFSTLEPYVDAAQHMYSYQGLAPTVLKSLVVLLKICAHHMHLALGFPINLIKHHSIDFIFEATTRALQMTGTAQTL